MRRVTFAARVIAKVAKEVWGHREALAEDSIMREGGDPAAARRARS
jgi:hypothetical protein